MTWKTQLGERHAVGPEAELIRDAIGYIHDVLEAEIDCLNDQWGFGVPIFDNPEPACKLCLLADVGEALRIYASVVTNRTGSVITVASPAISIALTCSMRWASAEGRQSENLRAVMASASIAGTSSSGAARRSSVTSVSISANVASASIFTA